MIIYLADVKIDVPPRVSSTEGMVNLVSVGDKDIMTRKITNEFVKAQLELAGYEMLSQYVGKDAKINFRCSANHLHQITWNDFRNGQRCGVCAGKYSITHEFVKSEFEAVGYEMLSEYVNSKTPIKFRCEQNHVWQITWGHFKHGERCAVCARKAKLTHEFVKAQFEAVGYEMLSEYVNSKTPIKFRCDQNHIHQIHWNSFNAGQRCGICSGRYSISHELVKAEFEKAGYEVLSEYVNSAGKIKFKCPKGHTHQISWQAFREGHRCGICARKTKLTHEFVAQQFGLAGYTLLEKYVSSQKPIKFKCPQGHFHQMSWGHFNEGQICIICSRIKQAESQKLDSDFVESQFALAGLEVLTPYIGSNTPIKFRCKNNHTHQIYWSAFKNGQRCGFCAGRYLSELDIRKAFNDEGYTLLGEYVNSITPLKYICPKGHHHEMTWSSFNGGSRCGLCHADKFYLSYKNKSASRIVGSIVREIERQSYSSHWSYFYTEDQIKAISEPIEEIYKTCPKGHAVDHIVPVSFYNLLSEDELIACWNPANLRHLDAIANSKRKNKMTPEEIAFMEQNHPEIINAASRRPLIAVTLS